MHVTVPQQQQGPALSRLRAAKDLAADCDRPFAEFTLSEAKDLAADCDRPFAEFTLSEAKGGGVTRCDGSNGQGHFVQIEPCLSKYAI
jgi:hypothetical protein